MTTTMNSSPDDLSLVSSQYGPGPCLGWLLAAISVMLTWVFESQEHGSENGEQGVEAGEGQKEAQALFSADFAAAIAFPLIAVGDLMLKLVRFPGTSSDFANTTNPELLSRLRAMEAPFAVIVCNMFISFLLGFFAVSTLHNVQAAIITLVELCGMVVLAHVRATIGRHLMYWPDCSFRMPIVVVSTIYFTMAWSFALMPMYFLVKREGASRLQILQRWDWLNKVIARLKLEYFVASMLLVYSSLLATTGIVVEAQAVYTVPDWDLSFWPWLVAVAKVPFLNLLPKTGNSILDIDQVVPVVVGASLLLLNIRRLLKARQKIRTALG